MTLFSGQTDFEIGSSVFHESNELPSNKADQMLFGRPCVAVGKSRKSLDKRFAFFAAAA
jgi:hypothetical protein